MTKTDRCPVCRQPTNAIHAPFCSRACKDRDLLKWLSDGYAIPGDPVDAEGLEGLDSPETRD